MNFFQKLFSKKPSGRESGNYNAVAFIVAAKVLAVEKHPNADRLRVIKLDIGSQIIYPVICGAFNFDVGAMVVLALPGAKIAQNIHAETHEPFVLSKAKIRGLESQGMICAAFELGLTKEPGDKPEIMLLKPDTKTGGEFYPEMLQ
jgi:phenylalanyl-tRNA synthetase beta chain